MEKIIQIAVDGHGCLFALTEDGKVYEWAKSHLNTIGGEGRWILLVNV